MIHIFLISVKLGEYRTDKALVEDEKQLKTFIELNESPQIISSISDEYVWLLEDLKYGWLGNDYRGALPSDKERTIKYLQDSIGLLQTPQHSSSSE